MRLWSRLGNEKTAQFPAIVAALEKWSRRLTQPVVLDGEIVALDDKGEPAGFQKLQQGAARTALIAFDILRVGRARPARSAAARAPRRARTRLRPDAVPDSPH